MELAIRSLHVLAAAVWVGGTVALVFVAVPYARSLPGEERAAALSRLGRRWRPLGWGSLAVLVATGLALAAEHGALRPRTLLHTGLGGVLLLKSGLVIALIALAAAHDFVLGPRLARQIREGGPETARPGLVRVGWASFALTLAVPVLGVLLASHFD